MKTTGSTLIFPVENRKVSVHNLLQLGENCRYLPPDIAQQDAEETEAREPLILRLLSSCWAVKLVGHGESKDSTSGAPSCCFSLFL